MPTVGEARKRADELGRVTVTLASGFAASASAFASVFGSAFAKFARGVAKVCAGIAAFARQVLREVPPALQLLGALGLCAILSIFGSVSFDNVLGKSCAIVFAPGFALAFGVVAHRWYQGLGSDRKGRGGGQTAGHSTSETGDSVAFDSVAYVDAKLTFALSAFGTERHQQAVVALIQAKTATELAFGPGPETAPRGPRPRIRDGGGAKPPRRESLSASENS